MSNCDNVQLETGTERGWEIKQAQEELKSVAESRVLAFSLQRSREKWLTSALPKFSSKVRKGTKAGSDTSSTPPPHNLHFRGKCEVQIGPHIFSNTSFYEVIYLPTSDTNQVPTPTSYAGLSTTSFAPSALELTMATPAFIDQINAAAATNPILASLLQLASAGQATQDQLQMLSITIRSLAANPIPASQYNGSNSPSIATSQSIKEFDLVIAFEETSSDRFIFPRGTTVCEYVSGSGDDIDIVVSSNVRLQSNDSLQPTAAELRGASARPHMLQMTLHGASESLWDTLKRWAGGEEMMKANKKTLNKLKGKQPRKIFLAYRLPEGPLLDQIKAATSAPYAMKSLKPPASLPKSRRIRKAAPKIPQVPEAPSLETQTTGKPSRRKRSTAESSAALDLVAAINGAGNSANYSPTQAHASALPSSSVSLATTSMSAAPPPAKKRKQRTSESQSQLAATKIECRSCGATDVPLMLGGRFCRPCVEAGRGTTIIPQLPSHGSRVPSAYTPKYIPPPPIANNPYLSLTRSLPSPTIPEPGSDSAAAVSHAPESVSVGILATPVSTAMASLSTDQSTS
ncbi:hypothetical protein J3R30DRAFT_3680388 [Lentinula aciculospora]|uniref:Uncharacterized protein n=1 Tax=Lentinula aciculospora TaxID=153920 RepID=A0A9W9AMF3_9AGAR|nr:hypothetical protein J3R30DRAFT_3680388 [Lentinula aciculospora]